MPQARPAPARGLRLPDKLPPSLPQKAWLRATPTRPRSPDTDGILRTPPPLPPGERPKAPATPAKAAARAPPDPLRLPRTTARSSYPPPLPLPPLLIRGFSFLRLACPSQSSRWCLPLRSPRGSLYNQISNGCSLKWRPLQATVAAGRDASVKRESQDGGPRRQAAEYQAAGPARGQLWGAPSSPVGDKEETCAFVLPGHRGGEAPKEGACRAFVAPE